MGGPGPVLLENRRTWCQDIYCNKAKKYQRRTTIERHNQDRWQKKGNLKDVPCPGLLHILLRHPYQRGIVLLPPGRKSDGVEESFLDQPDIRIELIGCSINSEPTFVNAHTGEYLGSVFCH